MLGRAKLYIESAAYRRSMSNLGVIHEGAQALPKERNPPGHASRSVAAARDTGPAKMLDPKETVRIIKDVVRVKMTFLRSGHSRASDKATGIMTLLLFSLSVVMV